MPGIISEGEPSKNRDLSKRTRRYALEIIRLFSSLAKNTQTQVIGKQLLRSGTSVGAHYSEANFAKSTKDFVSKIEGALQELEETVYWLDLLDEAELAKRENIEPLQKETRELIAIFVTIAKRAKAR